MVVTDRRVQFGVFIPPLHPMGQSPFLTYQNDLDLTVLLDRLGYDEVWFGEHHSGGHEFIGCPEIFIAAAAERTKQIRLGTGVVSLPYHHPLMVADRITMLDHLTRGRVIFGVGPGALPADAYMMGINPVDQRRRMEESLDSILALFRGECVTRETDWFVLRDAQLQMRPYSWPYPEVAVAATKTPSGPNLAGRLGCSLLSLGGLIADPKMSGYASLGEAWSLVEARAEQHQQQVDRRNWRVVMPVHIATSVEQAARDVAHGLPEFCKYFGLGGGALPMGAKGDDVGEMIDNYRASGMGVIGTPDELIAHIEDLQSHSGGFGTVLLLGHEWADREATARSYELIARYVIPHFQGQLDWPRRSHSWIAANRAEIFAPSAQAVEQAMAAHTPEPAAPGADRAAH